ncbi:hypothetical protein ColTof4_10556 [Colletotrichum tofieldiae]|nr:hypothetical protein ColTof3_05789 [Colletotrichum tofieldiae]GKT78133.1 hypothetical protein ColTof4_10556 [Colletotrichum tofieldiae]
MEDGGARKEGTEGWEAVASPRSWWAMLMAMPQTDIDCVVVVVKLVPFQLAAVSSRWTDAGAGPTLHTGAGVLSSPTN